MSKLNFCVWCGYRLDHSEKFCPRCGSNLSELKDQEEIITVAKTEVVEKEAPVKELTKYEIKINELKDIYDKKEEKALDLIQKSFTPDEITYSRFVEQLNRNHEAFYKKVDLALELNSMVDGSSFKVETEIEKTIKILEEMLEQLKSLIVEFIINPIYDKKSADEEIDSLREDMDNLIKSVRKYQ